MGASNAIWNTEGTTKREAVREMFGQIAPRYDLLNSLISFKRHHRWRAHATSLLSLKPGGKALDVCCGTGDFQKPLRDAVGASGVVIGLDFSAPMLEVGKKKGVPSDALILADACRIPISSSAFDGVSVGWGIRNVPDIDLAHREIARVLQPGGRFVSVDMAIPRNGFIRLMSRFVGGAIMPALGSLFGFRDAYTYLPKSTEKFWTREQLAESMTRAGFKDCGWRDLMFGNVCVHWGTKA
jgi:demethylmenaquinone methyltransferase / 2-methoxy-6-polyprenyl-1,4-benzoquinol methylase